jgi:ADP-ribose pyrophosphatase YjhB (NUDIX family)
MFIFCPSCASRAIRFEHNKVFRCPDCGFEYYHNVASATGCIIDTGTSIAFSVRAKEPARGKLALPGGFVNPSEGALEGLRRECLEELAWDPGDELTFYASFPNVYLYKGFCYNTCDLFFSVFAPSVSAVDFRLDPNEVEEVRFLLYNCIDFNELAFDSTRRAVRVFLDRKTSGEKW